MNDIKRHVTDFHPKWKVVVWHWASCFYVWYVECCLVKSWTLKVVIWQCGK